ncbi:MAG: hypothetical protein QNJ65_23095 [Xenococcaceae cyanobacterium MO_234.B1]|nr:hypothetical protein [Xenococcaceae cyanobacterium MO_234.B1]
MKNFLVGIITLVICGCTSMLTPVPNEEVIFGRWESVGFFPYSVFEYNGKGNSFLVVVNNDYETKVYNVKHFVPSTSKQYEFEIELHDVSGEETTQKLYGSLLNNSLGFSEKSNEGAFVNFEESIWYSKSNEIMKAKAIALTVLKEHLKVS